MDPFQKMKGPPSPLIPDLQKRFRNTPVTQFFGHSLYSPNAPPPRLSIEEKYRKVHNLCVEGYKLWNKSWDRSPLSVPGLKAEISLESYQCSGVRMLERIEGNFGRCVLADDMGLGKTLQILALLAREKGRSYNGPKKCRWPTLIVVERLGLDVWTLQLQRFFNKGSLNYIVYHDNYYQGQKRHQWTANDIFSTDIVITTYETVRTEWQEVTQYQEDFHRYHFRTDADLLPERESECQSVKRPRTPYSAIFSPTWARVVLDEGQRIRNSTSKVHQALAEKCFDKCKWIIVSGTPYMNYIKDIGSVFRILRVQPFDSPGDFNSTFVSKKEGSATLDADLIDTLADLLSIIWNSFTIRRLSKDHLQLPRLTVHNIPFHLDTTRTIQYGEAHGSNPRFRPRTEYETQGMVRPSWDSTLDKHADITIEDHNNARRSTAHWAVNRCTFSADTQKVSKQIKIHGCEYDEDWSQEMRQIWQASTKMQMVVDRIRDVLANDPEVKIVVFDHTPAVLYIASCGLDHWRISHTTIHGGIPDSEREKIRRSFNSDDPGSPRVLLATMRTAGVGIDLTRASVVIIITPQYTPLDEDQAYKRCHRKGQKKPVDVYRFLAHDSKDVHVVDKFQFHKHTQSESILSQTLHTTIQQWAHMSYDQFIETFSNYVRF